MPHIGRSIALILALSIALPREFRAQGIRPVIPRASAVVTPPHSSDRAVISAKAWRAAGVEPTHWLEGGVIGAAVLSAGGYVLGSLFCDQNCGARRMEGALVGAGAGFTIGALIGGAFPKREPAPASPDQAH